MIKTVKIGLLLLASIIMGTVIMLLNDVSIIDTMAASYFIVVNSFLGLDMANMIKKSAALPVGEFKNMKFGKYVLGLVIMAILFGMALYRKEFYDIQAIMTISSFGGGVMLIIGFIIGGLEGNRMASKIGVIK